MFPGVVVPEVTPPLALLPPVELPPEVVPPVDLSLPVEPEPLELPWPEPLPVEFWPRASVAAARAVIKTLGKCDLI